MMPRFVIRGVSIRETLIYSRISPAPFMNLWPGYRASTSRIVRSLHSSLPYPFRLATLPPVGRKSRRPDQSGSRNIWSCTARPKSTRRFATGYGLLGNRPPDVMSGFESNGILAVMFWSNDNGPSQFVVPTLLTRIKSNPDDAEKKR